MQFKLNGTPSTVLSIFPEKISSKMKAEQSAAESDLKMH